MEKHQTENQISVTMISNAMNHHQFPFCDSMSDISDISFQFVATKPISSERIKTGFQDLNSSREYIVRSYESESERNKAQQLVDNSDFVIYGSAPYEMLKNRKKNGKWIFLYSERLFKESRSKDPLNLKTIMACILRYFFSSHNNLRLLCSSAFSSNDYRFFRFNENQAYKWGYFPPISKHSFQDVINSKENNSIIWVGRMIHWKHAELAIELAKKLKQDSVPFQMKLIGDGPMAETLKEEVKKFGLQENVHFLGVLNTEQTRFEMERAQIMISTSDHNEGWGAVINEGMASGCAMAASHLMGSVPYLIKDDVNGCVFESGNLDDLYIKVKTLLKDKEICDKYAENAYRTITEKWNAKVAAERLAELFRQYKSGNTDFAFESDICSHAERLSNNWFQQ